MGNELESLDQAILAAQLEAGRRSLMGRFLENHPRVFGVVAGFVGLAAVTSCSANQAPATPGASDMFHPLPGISDSNPNQGDGGIDPANNTASIPEQTNIQQSSEAPDPVESTSIKPSTFTLEPAPDASELPESLQKYRINVKQAEANPSEYWSTWAKSIGMTVNPLSKEDLSNLDKYYAGNGEIPGSWANQLGTLIGEKQNGNLSAYANAYVNNKKLPADQKIKMIEVLGAYFTDDNMKNYEEDSSSFLFLNDFNKILDGIASGKSLDIEIAGFDFPDPNNKDGGQSVCGLNVSVDGRLIMKDFYPRLTAESDAYSTIDPTQHVATFK